MVVQILLFSLKETKKERCSFQLIQWYTGQAVWNARFPGNAADVSPSGVTTATSNQFLQNPLNLAFVEMSRVIVALNGESGQVAWQWTIPSNVTITSMSGWGDTVALLAQGQPYQSPYFPTPITPTVLIAVDAVSGATLWMQNATVVVPQTQAEASSYAVECFIAGEEFLFYSRGSKLAAVNRDGSIQWRTAVNLDSSIGVGQGANVTHMVYIPRKPDSDSPIPPRILANANNWSFQRFVLLSLNDTNTSMPATGVWRSKIPETAIDDIYFTQPIVDPYANQGMFYYWSNRTDWGSGTTAPSWKINLVGRDLTNGNEMWKIVAVPVGLPSTFLGRLMVVTSDGLMAMEGASGATIWTILGTPPTEYSYNVSPTFGNASGILVASRCLGPAAPNLCMYSAFAPESGAAARNGYSAVAVVATMIVSLLTVF